MQICTTVQVISIVRNAKLLETIKQVSNSGSFKQATVARLFMVYHFQIV